MIPSETKNAIGDYPDIVADLTDKITSIVCNGRTTSGENQANDTDYWDDLTWISSEDYQARQLR